MNERSDVFKSWLTSKTGCEASFSPLTGDASFRRYFRGDVNGRTLIAVDAPPSTENNRAFRVVTELLEQQGIVVPKILAFEESMGFMLLSDLGDRLLLGALQSQDATLWYERAFPVLLKLQQSSILHPEYTIPLFDREHTYREFGYFEEWCLSKLLEIQLSSAETLVLKHSFEHLNSVLESQPQVMVHRDFHSRNIMVLPADELAIIDYQDAMIGPLTYDLVSLLRDCYLTWPKDQVTAWVASYYNQMRHQGTYQDVSLALFRRWFDLTGVQRHLKVLGVFSRLNLRDHKPGYLKDMPRIVHYVLDVLADYQEFEPLVGLFMDRIVPSFEVYWKKIGLEQAA